MAKRKLFIIILILSIFAAGCRGEKVVISDIILTEDNMIIEIDTVNTDINFNDPIRIHYKNIPTTSYFFIKKLEKEQYDKKNLRFTLTLELKEETRTIYEEEISFDKTLEERILFINEEAKMMVGIFGGFLTADIFIEKDKVYILEQDYSSRRYGNID